MTYTHASAAEEGSMAEPGAEFGEREGRREGRREGGQWRETKSWTDRRIDKLMMSGDKGTKRQTGVTGRKKKGDSF